MHKGTLFPKATAVAINFSPSSEEPWHSKVHPECIIAHSIAAIETNATRKERLKNRVANAMQKRRQEAEAAAAKLAQEKRRQEAEAAAKLAQEKQRQEAEAAAKLAQEKREKEEKQRQEALRREQLENQKREEEKRREKENNIQHQQEQDLVAAQLRQEQESSMNLGERHAKDPPSISNHTSSLTVGESVPPRKSSLKLNFRPKPAPSPSTLSSAVPSRATKTIPKSSTAPSLSTLSSVVPASSSVAIPPRITKAVSESSTAPVTRLIKSRVSELPFIAIKICKDMVSQNSLYDSVIQPDPRYHGDLDNIPRDLPVEDRIYFISDETEERQPPPSFGVDQIEMPYFSGPILGPSNLSPLPNIGQVSFQAVECIFHRQPLLFQDDLPYITKELSFPANVKLDDLMLGLIWRDTPPHINLHNLFPADFDQSGNVYPDRMNVGEKPGNSESRVDLHKSTTKRTSKVSGTTESSAFTAIS
ncbi:hypothetical protein BTUL_0134g00170 [Botrytis tulipae]|uniref:Uncharacterized protein n=1 Tax=Botrytis tulipae TaxID=87230 RepID=A0A4Z1EJB6_9HELO|nr:hypothetical protein BTUL_0134g00170 [Botrytis tulipae]